MAGGGGSKTNRLCRWVWRGWRLGIPCLELENMNRLPFLEKSWRGIVMVCR